MSETLTIIDGEYAAWIEDSIQRYHRSQIKAARSVNKEYALEGINLPVGMSEFELAKLYPDKIEGTTPTIEEIELIQ